MADEHLAPHTRNEMMTQVRQHLVNVSGLPTRRGARSLAMTHIDDGHVRNRVRHRVTEPAAAKTR